MTCRAPDNTTTCAGTPTGAQLGYDNEGRLATWQNAPSSPTTTDSFLYDGAGNRVEQQVTINGSMTTTTTYVAGGLEEIGQQWDGHDAHQVFHGAGGLPTAERVGPIGAGGPLNYLATDGQGTVSESLDRAGNVTAANSTRRMATHDTLAAARPRVWATRGSGRMARRGWTTTMPGTMIRWRGSSPPPIRWPMGLNRYSYVHGNPTTATDPTGHRTYLGGGDSSKSYTPPPPPHLTEKRKTKTHRSRLAKTSLQSVGVSLMCFTRIIRSRYSLELAEAGSAIGWQILNWILSVGAVLGDAFISWDISKSGEGGYTDFGGLIHLNPVDDILDGDTFVTAAADLVHEGVESYYAIEHGVRTQASVQMDYLAEKYSGEYQYENEFSGGAFGYRDDNCLSENDCYYGAYTLSFSQWLKTPEGVTYTSFEPMMNVEAEFGLGIAPGFAFVGSSAYHVGFGYTIYALEMDFRQLRYSGLPNKLPIG